MSIQNCKEVHSSHEALEYETPTSEVITLIGGGKITFSLLVPEFSYVIAPNAALIVTVRNLPKWIKLSSTSDGSVDILLTNPHSHKEEIYSIPIRKEKESLNDFLKRCNKNNIAAGIYIVKKDEELQELINKSSILATSTGIDGLDSFAEKLTKLETNRHAIYAFENSPEAVYNIAQKYHFPERGLEFIPCPIDRVVVNREFNFDKSQISLTLGRDQTKSILIHDKYGDFEPIFTSPLRENSCITITPHSTDVKTELLKKYICKNVPHKVDYHEILFEKENKILPSNPPCVYVNDTVFKTMEVLKPVLVSITLALNFNNTHRITELSKETLKRNYVDWSNYYDNAIKTLNEDPYEHIERVIHLDTAENALADKNRLIKSLEYYKTVVESDTFKVLCEVLHAFEISDMTPANSSEILTKTINKLNSHT